jgi:hypothetical protein
MSDNDKEYRELLKAERRVKKIKQENNYHCVNPPCCMTCEFSSQALEENMKCGFLTDDKWDVGDVEPCGLCDKYQKVVHV